MKTMIIGYSIMSQFRDHLYRLTVQGAFVFQWPIWQNEGSMLLNTFVSTQI